MAKIKFDKDGNFLSVDKRYLKKHSDYGYYFKERGLIHYFDKNKNYERSKMVIN